MGTGIIGNLLGEEIQDTVKDRISDAISAMYWATVLRPVVLTTKLQEIRLVSDATVFIHHLVDRTFQARKTEIKQMRKGKGKLRS